MPVPSVAAASGKEEAPAPAASTSASTSAYTAPTPPPAKPVPSPSNPVLASKEAQWLFTDSDLRYTPSLLDGMSMETEHTQRSKGVNFITQVGILLKLPQLTLCTASVYMHRFFMRYSMVDLPQRPGRHPYPIAATALFLATKVEENCRKMKELIVACCRVALKQPNVIVDEQSKEFWKWRDTILHNEDLLLEALCFDLQLEQPYRLLYDFICFFQVQDDKRLRNSAWAFVNDSTFTVLCVQFSARTIAASALYAAAMHCDAAFADDELGRPWWEQIDVDVREVRRACNRMAEIYDNYPLPKPGQKYAPAPSPVNGEEATDSTRRVFAQNAGRRDSQGGQQVNGRKHDREEEHEPGEIVSNGTTDSPKRQRRESEEPASRPRSAVSVSGSPAANPTSTSTATATATATTATANANANATTNSGGRQVSNSFTNAASNLNLSSANSSQQKQEEAEKEEGEADEGELEEGEELEDGEREDGEADPAPPRSQSRVPASYQKHLHQHPQPARMEHPLPPPPPPPSQAQSIPSRER
ncbi:cyclin, putative [Trichophyton verrucosum HKI 0517]|uniref:RNA polymerase II holoenzyme cyclin-like subunit n=1 Tax=Trichophyton verrucosum (strain HKI 0517) TaxID=663202 RepID=D4D010_TRIVH|nr:cyclin, putative [Trichophyton verrucosum HKI 0517]EFE44803.1 cyclin, putative [Trichophyton verrucosum HKI 0517]